MPNYEDTFNARGDLYNAASRRCPDARAVERALLIDLLDPEGAERIADIPAGGGYLAEGIAADFGRPDRIVCVEPAPAFAAGIAPSFSRVIAPMEAIAIRDESFDRVGSLAGLHHIEDRAPVFDEFHRILAPGGIIAVADVVDGTLTARFLNESVDRFSATGHKGMFFGSGEMARLLRSAGFEDVRENVREFFWTFDSWPLLVEYCGLLFGLVRATRGDIEGELARVFGLMPRDGTARLPWSLVYASGKRI